MHTRILAVGDIVGEEALTWLTGQLPRLRDQYDIDWIVVNAENCTVTGPSPMNGFGLSVRAVQSLIDAGVDVVTGGNHSWDGPEVEQALAHPTVVRPWNVESGFGRGVLRVQRDGRSLAVINLLSPTAQLPDMRAPQPEPLWDAWLRIREEVDFSGLVLVDLHGESPWEKASFASAVDGEVTAVVGTHTHDPSLRGHILPAGTGLVTELGMTGRLGFTGGGFDPVHFAAALRGDDIAALPPFRLATGPLTAGAVLLAVGDDGRVEDISRLELGEQP